MERIAVYGKAEDVTELDKTTILEDMNNIVFAADVLRLSFETLNALDTSTVKEIIKQQKICFDSLRMILELFSKDLMNSLPE